MVLVEGGGGFLQNFQFMSTGWIPEVRGNDLIVRKSSEACPEPSSSSGTPSSSSITPSSSSENPTPIFSNRENPQIGQIAVQAKGMHIVLENLPSNAKIEIFNLQGKRIYSAYPENPKILRNKDNRHLVEYPAMGTSASLVIGVQTKGMYIVKINNSITLKMPVM
jgi:hypothetical protein